MTVTPHSDFPPIPELIPHTGPMILLDRVLAHSPERTTCERTIRADDIFLSQPQNDVPVWIGIEYMAQCVAAHARLLIRGVPRGALPKRGFLVGARQIHFHTSGFRIGQRLQISAKPATGVLNFLSFDGEVRDAETDALLVAGQIHIFIDHDPNHAGPPTFSNSKEQHKNE